MDGPDQKGAPGYAAIDDILDFAGRSFLFSVF
jgi:hypothetical protein